MNVPKNKKDKSSGSGSGSSNAKGGSNHIKEDHPSSLQVRYGDDNSVTESNADDVSGNPNGLNGNDSDDGQPVCVMVSVENDLGDDENNLLQEGGDCCQHGISHTTDDDDGDGDGDSLEAPTCTICFCPFEEGDRIGDLPCRHEFHVDCLKGWLQRRNSCPLCNARLGRPERPGLPSDSSMRDLDTSHHSISSLIQRIRIRQNNINNRQLSTNGDGDTTRAARELQTILNRLDPPAASVGEIQRGSRVGMIGSVSAAEDIASTVSTRRNFERRSSY